MSAESKLPSVGRPWMRPFLSGLAILLCGVLIGGALTTLVLWDRLSHEMRHPRFDPLEASLHIAEKFNLDDGQAKRLQQIVAEHDERFNEVRATVSPTLDSLSINFRDEVAALLGPEQTAEWIEEFNDHHRQFKKRPPRDFRRPPSER